MPSGSFRAVEGVLPTYAYNVTRREFDDLIAQTALAAGARFIEKAAVLEVAPAKERGRVGVRLGAASLARESALMGVLRESALERWEKAPKARVNASRRQVGRPGG